MHYLPRFQAELESFRNRKWLQIVQPIVDFDLCCTQMAR